MDLSQGSYGRKIKSLFYQYEYSEIVKRVSCAWDTRLVHNESIRTLRGHYNDKL